MVSGLRLKYFQAWIRINFKLRGRIQLKLLPAKSAGAPQHTGGMALYFGHKYFPALN